MPKRRVNPMFLAVPLILFTAVLSRGPLTWAQNPPYPPSPVISGIRWDATIIRRATGSDTWPLTWADDGNLYTAYGDGQGFDPKVPTKLSLGFAKVASAPPSITGTNIRSASGEQTGDGATGKKASGLLMVNRTLYMWVRNADHNGKHAQLAWSTDLAKTWTWSSWQFPDFGSVTFLNFGRNYAGARDGYVYAYSHDHPSAYTAADRFILMRVPKDRITTRSAYRFFKGLDANGNPLWTQDITQRGAVFTHPGRCRRSGITYNAGLGRYLWWQQNSTGTGADTRFDGGFGIYDAPQPWGPWTTVYYTPDWDVGPGETGSFPTKWMSSDGRVLYLVFSGNDAFSVRKATLTVRAPTVTALPAPTAVRIVNAGQHWREFTLDYPEMLPRGHYGLESGREGPELSVDLSAFLQLVRWAQQQGYAPAGIAELMPWVQETYRPVEEEPREEDRSRP